MSTKLFIPGPTEVRREVLETLSHPQVGHRTEEFKELFGSLKPGLQKLFGTKNDVLISTSSGSGMWEAAIRSCVQKKVLHAVNGAFSKKWAAVSKRCGKESVILNFPDGEPVDPNTIEKELAKGDYEAFCMVHNETSTGTVTNLEKMAEMMKKFPDVLWLVDAVSSFAGVPLDVDKHGVDICLASSQKALALPAGIAVASVSDKAYKKAETVKGRGYYFDILELKKMYDKDQTPYTPAIPQLYALQFQLERIDAEGVEQRFARHEEMAGFIREWVKNNGFKMFSSDGAHSGTVACIVNTKDLDFSKIKSEMKDAGYSIDSGYGKMNAKLQSEGKPTTFRIPHMGDLTLEEMKEYTKELEKYWVNE